MPKSVTVKIGGDTSDFLKEMQKADREINKTQKTANNLAKSLEFEFDGQRAAQAQKQFQAALEQTETKAQRLRDKLKELEAGGKLNEESYSALELELAKTEAKAADLKNRLEEIKNIDVTRLADGFKNAGDKITAAGQKLSAFSVAAAGAIAGAAAIGKKAAETGAEIDDMTQQFDISAETIQRWSYLALQAGVDSTSFTRALIRARAAMADLATGTSNAATQALEELGIAADQFGSDEEMFDGIIEALSKVEDSTLQTAYANEIFGDRIATQLLPYINAGAEDLAKWNAEFDEMPSLTGEEAAALALLDDTFNRLNTTMQYATAQLGLAFAPVIERVVEWIEASLVPALESLAEWFGNLSPGMQNAILGILGIVAVAGPLLIIIGKISSGIGSLIGILGQLSSAAASSFGIIGIIIGVLAAAYMANEEFRESINNLAGTLLEALTPILKLIGNILSGTIAPVLELIGNIVAVVLLPALKMTEPILRAIADVLNIIYEIIGPIIDGISYIIDFVSNSIIGKAIEGIGNLFGFSRGESKQKETPKIDSDRNQYNFDRLSSDIMSGNYESTVLQPNSGAAGDYYSDNSYSSSDTINITVNGTNLSAEEIARAVSKEIATLKQARR